MSGSLEKKYPPYSGNEAFIFLCICREDESAAEAILERLYRRGCRVWYTVEASRSMEQEHSAQARMKQAGLVIAYCSETFLTRQAKGNMMFLQAAGIPVIVIEPQQVDNLSAGLREGTVHISAYDGFTDETEAQLISSEGFSQSFIGTRPEPGMPKVIKMLLGVLLTLILAAAAVFALILTGVIKPEESDPAEVVTLTLVELPEDISTLEQYPNLEKLIIPQSQAKNAEKLPDKYTVVIRGEG